jgi:hypothetical protein
MKERVVLCLVLVPVLLGLGVATAIADPDLPLVQPHRHFLQQPDGSRVAIGPQICGRTDNLGLWRAFSEFHNNLHVAGPASQGPAAPGLHNGRGGELVATGC